MITTAESPLVAVALRLRPDDDLIGSIEAVIREQQIEAACILTCVGSLHRVQMRYADQDMFTLRDGKFEIVSMIGTLSIHGSHVHLSISDRQGRTFGGHIADGCLIYTTAEVVLGVLPQIRFRREHDPASGYDELVVGPRD